MMQTPLRNSDTQSFFHYRSFQLVNAVTGVGIDNISEKLRISPEISGPETAMAGGTRSQSVPSNY
jgi:hypothetical protein